MSVREQIIEDCSQKYGVNIDFDTKYIYTSSSGLVYDTMAYCQDTKEIVNLAFVRSDTMNSCFGTNIFYSYTDKTHQVYFNMDRKVNRDGLIIVNKSQQFKLILTDDV